MTVLLILLGLAVGSFLNVLILRYDPDKDGHSERSEESNGGKKILRFYLRMTTPTFLKTAGGRSRCLHCGHQLRWYELIPVVSWIIQLGKCRNCKKYISLQYPVVELASAALFVFVPWAVEWLLFQTGEWIPAFAGMTGDMWMLYGFSAFWILVFLMLMAAFFIDVRHYVIPNYLNLSIFIAGIVWTVVRMGSFLGSYADLFSFGGSASEVGLVLNHILGMVLGAGFFLVVIFITRGKGMGLGDAKLMAGLGLLFGYPDILIVMVLSFVLGTLYALPLLAMGKKGMKSMLPFGPFIVLASFLVFFFGTRILQGYFGIIEGLSL
ncbi:hypothetical protein A2755_00925 [Candidatus Wolfebacteria bacterium RIFCSPHIGHO2_01_FULL_48_22]|uniref:Prepilin peptidase n=2 Tax=Candidatus Wolfeibacteriota TaxID=1752735 RepID=A0A1F8DTG9_9BACT|nr:MAG: hypothetical protein A2755_00925 [Candidatus Wolfebacteria bacterium RIFCSPHIGHO2_01_FULL_48_22]OGM93575.1 MAG: hypothetical protein A2935_03040 [Candidatus Wolfebacteria bacterium RIFCSPLOWO2_01_FULL_47_17b]